MSSLATFKSLVVDAQHNRLLRLSFPNHDAPFDTLLANRLEGTEYLSKDFHFSVEILAYDAGLKPQDFIGKQLCVELLRNDGSFRAFNGYIFAFGFKKTDGGMAFYEAQIGPWLRYLKLRQNNRLFLDQTLYEQTGEIFKDYSGLPVWDWQVKQADDPKMTMACQFGEDDHNYLHRRWEHMGWLYYYEHTATQHKLILAEDSTALPAIDGLSPEIRFQSQAGSLEDDGLSHWSPTQQVTSNSVAFSRFDFKNPAPHTVNTQALQHSADLPTLEYHEYAGSYGFKNTQDGDDMAVRRMEEIETRIETFTGRGNNRFVMPGRWFHLADHFHFSREGSTEDNDFLIVSVHHQVSNNYLQAVDTPSEYRNELTCIRRNRPWRPGRGYNSVDTRILAPQTATVVGMDDSTSVHTDEHGRCRVRFHWDRDARHSTWVRVASNWSGGGQGLVALPRIGSEVIVQWLDGNPDRPIITGRVANANNLHAWQLPDQSALMGIRSRELNGNNGNGMGGRSNHLVFDDTAGQIQTQLKSDHQHSQLSLGYITRIENFQGRQDARGEGFELRTDSVGAIRSGQGLLSSTEIRPMAKSHLSDVGEPSGRLTQAKTLHSQLAKLAQKHDAQDDSGQSAVADTLKQQNEGIQGKGSDKASNTGKDSFPELNEAHLLLAGAAGIASTTPASTHIASGEHVAITAGGDVSVVSGKSLFASVSDKLSLFVHKLGMKLIAASGKVQIQAQNDELELLAKKVVSIISTSDWITLSAKQGIRLNAGNSQLVISADGINGFTPGTNLIHAASHSTAGPKSVPAQFPGADLCPSAASGAAQSGAASVAV